MAKIDKVQEVANSVTLHAETRRVSDLIPYPNNPRIIDKAVPQLFNLKDLDQDLYTAKELMEKQKDD